MKKVAVVLAGCGHMDGAEIHEAVLSLYFIEKYGMTYEVFAPDVQQHHVMNHYTKQESAEKRNVLAEAARIARGRIKDLAQLNVNDFNALYMPGGFGAAKNLCDYAFKGSDVKVLAVLDEKIKAFNNNGKYVCAVCIAPVIAAKSLGSKKVEVTIGDDQSTADDVRMFGAKHVSKPVTEFHHDEKNKVLSAPAYMYNAKITEVAAGIEKMVKKLSEVI